MLFDHNDRVAEVPPPTFVSGWNPQLRALLKFSNKANGGVNTLFLTLYPFKQQPEPFFDHCIAIQNNNLSKGGLWSFLVSSFLLKVWAIYLFEIRLCTQWHPLFIMFTPYQKSNVSLRHNNLPLLHLRPRICRI